MFIDTPYAITRAHADLYVEQVGPDDAAALYYLHGGPGYNSFSFRDLVGEELERFRMVYADQRGAGRSYADAPFDLDTLADDVRSVLDALDIERAGLLAHGFGALIAVRAAGLLGRRVERLLLVNPWLSMPLLARTLQRRAAQLADRPTASLPPEGALAEPEALDPEAVSNEAFSLVPAKTLFDALLFPNPAARLRLEHSDSEALFGPQQPTVPERVWTLDVTTELEALTQPVVILAGRQDGTALDQAEAALALLPDATFSLLDAGHYPWLDDPETFTTLLYEVVGGG